MFSTLYLLRLFLRCHARSFDHTRIANVIEFSSVAMDSMMYPALVGLTSSPPINTFSCFPSSAMVIFNQREMKKWLQTQMIISTLTERI